jgi:transcriptional regulator with XRE-family HTH domain
MPSQATSRLATTLAQNVRLARALGGMTQRSLAEKLDTDAGLVSKWERGKHRPSDENLVAIGETIDRDLLWFYSDHSAEFEQFDQAA